jgi:hypothetical protein
MAKASPDVARCIIFSENPSVAQKKSPESGFFAIDLLELASRCRIVCLEECRATRCAGHRAEACGHLQLIREIDMHQLIYLVGLIVVILAILSFFGLR